MSNQKMKNIRDYEKIEGHPLLVNFPLPVEEINWEFITKEKYQEFENILTQDVVFFEPVLIDNFYPQDMFDELVSILTKEPLEKIDYSNQMNKWEQGFEIPRKFIDYAVNKAKEIIGTDDIEFAYNMYAPHQITEDGRVPKLPLHIDWAPGPYMIDLHIGGNRDWGFVARYKNFVTKPNQAIICQPQFDYHYRPSWGSSDIYEYYQAFFLHLVNKNHWSCKSDKPGVSRSKELNERHNFGLEFRNSEDFINFQSQRRGIFEKHYLSTLLSKDVPLPPFDEKPSEEDTHIHQRKGVKIATTIGDKNGNKG